MPAYTNAGRPPSLLKTTRKWFVYIHRWLSLITGLLVLVITTSGAVLVFNQEIYDYEVPGLVQTTAGPGVTLDDAAAAVLAAHPGSTVTWLGTTHYRPNHGVYEVDILTADGEEPWIYVDPSTGAILDEFDYESSALDWWLTLHDSFFLDDVFPDAAPGGIVVGILGIALLLMTLTGLVVWWPSIRNWVLAFTIRWHGRGWYTRNFDLHKVIGIVTLPLLLVITVTGISYEFYDPFTAGWYALLPGAVTEPEGLVSQPSDQPPLSYTALIAKAQALYPDAEVAYLYPPEEADSGFYVFLSGAFNPGWADSSNITVLLDRYTGAVLFQNDLRTAPLSQRVYDGWFWPLHVGNFGGWASKLIWFLAGLAPLALAVTSVITWVMRRFLRPRQARARRLAQPVLEINQPVAGD